jgi:hypothetical protein
VNDNYTHVTGSGRFTYVTSDSIVTIMEYSLVGDTNFSVEFTTPGSIVGPNRFRANIALGPYLLLAGDRKLGVYLLEW